MTTYTLHTLCLVACSILPERKHRRCFEGSQRERIGSVIRSRCKAIQLRIFAGSFRAAGSGRAAGIHSRTRLSGIVKYFVAASARFKAPIPERKKSTVSGREVEPFLQVLSIHTLKRLKINIKGTSACDSLPDKLHFRVKMLPNMRKAPFYPDKSARGGVPLSILSVIYPIRFPLHNFHRDSFYFRF